MADATTIGLYKMNSTEQQKFWETRAKARRNLDKRLANLPFEEKIVIMKTMEEAHTALRNAKAIK